MSFFPGLELHVSTTSLISAEILHGLFFFFLSFFIIEFYFLPVDLLLKKKKNYTRGWNRLFIKPSFLTQSKSEVKKESGESSPSEAACLCSPPAAKNQCASCGMEIHDRYLLKVSRRKLMNIYTTTKHNTYPRSLKGFKLQLHLLIWFVAFPLVFIFVFTSWIDVNKTSA